MILFNNNNNNNNAILNDTIKQEEKEMNKLLYDNKFIYNIVVFYPLYVNNNFNATLNDIKFQLNKV